MKRTLLAGAAILLAVSSAAFADDKPIVAGAGLSPNMTATPVTPGTPDGQPSTIPHSTTTEATPDAATPAVATPTVAAASESPPASSNPNPREDLFAIVAANDDLSSSVIGVEVYNKDNQDIGTIKDIAFGADGVRAYIVGVGGFLGLGDRYVAVRPSSLTLSQNADDKKWHAVLDTDATKLTAAPQFKYPSNS